MHSLYILTTSAALGLSSLNIERSSFVTPLNCSAYILSSFWFALTQLTVTTRIYAVQMHFRTDFYLNAVLHWMTAWFEVQMQKWEE